MEQEKRLFGLIGFPLGHSWSPDWYNRKFAAEGETTKEYRLFPLSRIEEFPALLKTNPFLAGLNVTIPYKTTVIPFLDELDETAGQVGAVNTIRITRNNNSILTKGFNTDSPGFLQTLPGINTICTALILGTGGGARAVSHALNARNIPFTFVSRGPRTPGTITYDDLTSDVLHNNTLIIYTTPLGMFPATDKYPPIPYHHLTEKHFLYDLIYNPEVTEFLKRGIAMKTSTMSGYQMLVNQAELSYKIFKINL